MRRHRGAPEVDLEGWAVTDLQMTQSVPPPPLPPAG